MKVTFEAINKRLGYDFLEADNKHWEEIDTEYDGKRPTDDLNEEEREFYLEYLLNKNKSENEYKD